MLQGAPPTPTAPTSSPLSATRAAAHSRGAGRSALQQAGVPLLRQFRRSAELAASLQTVLLLTADGTG
jgi:hypothetical protein